MPLLCPMNWAYLHCNYLFVFAGILGYCGFALEDISTLDAQCLKKGDCLMFHLRRERSLESSEQQLHENVSSSSISAGSSEASINPEVSKRKSSSENNGPKNVSGVILLPSIRTVSEGENLQDEAKNLSTPDTDSAKVYYWSGVIFNGDKGPTHPEFRVSNVSQILSSLKHIPGNGFSTGGDRERNSPYFFFILPQGNIRHDLRSNQELNALNESSSRRYTDTYNRHPYFVSFMSTLPTYSDYRDSQRLRNVPEPNFHSSHGKYQQEQSLNGKFTRNNEMTPVVIINRLPGITPEQNRDAIFYFSGYQPELKLSREVGKIPSLESKTTGEKEKTRFSEIKSSRETEKIQLPELNSFRETEITQSPQLKTSRQTEKTQSPELKTSEEKEKTDSPGASVPCKRGQNVNLPNKFIFVPIPLDSQSQLSSGHQSIGGYNYILRGYSQQNQKQSGYNLPFGQYNSNQHQNNFPGMGMNTQSLSGIKTADETQVASVGPVALHVSENQNNLPLISSFFYKYENQNKQFRHLPTGTNAENGDPKPIFIVHRSGLLQQNLSEDTRSMQLDANSTKTSQKMDFPNVNFGSNANNYDPAKLSRKSKRSLNNSEFSESNANKVDVLKAYLVPQSEKFLIVPEKDNTTGNSSDSTNAVLNASEVYVRSASTKESESKGHTVNSTDGSLTDSETRSEEEPVYSPAFSTDVSPCINDSGCYRSYEIGNSNKGADGNDGTLKQVLYEHYTKGIDDHAALFRKQQNFSSESYVKKGNQTTALMHTNNIPVTYRYFRFSSAEPRQNMNGSNFRNSLQKSSFTENSYYRNFPSDPPVGDYGVNRLRFGVYGNKESRVQTNLQTVHSTGEQVIKSPTSSTYSYYNRLYPTGIFLKRINVQNYRNNPSYLASPKESRNFKFQTRNYATQSNASDNVNTLGTAAIHQREHLPNSDSYRPNSLGENTSLNNRNMLPQATQYYIKEDPVFQSETGVPFTVSFGRESSQNFENVPSEAEVYTASQIREVILHGNSRENLPSYSYSTEHNEPQDFSVQQGGGSTSETSMPFTHLDFKVVGAVQHAIPPLQNVNGRVLPGMELSQGFGSESDYGISQYREPREPHTYAWNRL